MGTRWWDPVLLVRKLMAQGGDLPQITVRDPGSQLTSEYRSGLFSYPCLADFLVEFLNGLWGVRGRNVLS